MLKVLVFILLVLESFGSLGRKSILFPDFDRIIALHPNFNKEPFGVEAIFISVSFFKNILTA